LWCYLSTENGLYCNPRYFLPFLTSLTVEVMKKLTRNTRLISLTPIRITSTTKHISTYLVIAPSQSCKPQSLAWLTRVNTINLNSAIAHLDESCFVESTSCFRCVRCDQVLSMLGNTDDGCVCPSILSVWTRNLQLTGMNIFNVIG